MDKHDLALYNQRGLIYCKTYSNNYIVAHTSELWDVYEALLK